MSALERLIDPKTIAIAGVSADERKHGARVLGNLRRMGYSGRVWGVNPGRPDIEGLEVFQSVQDLPDPPDLVVAATPATATTDVVAGCRGVGAVVVFASGYAETGYRGRQSEAELVAAARSVGTRVLGPNSAGVIRPDRGLAASFLTCLDRPPGEIAPGPVALVTQSGGTGSYIHNLAAERGDGLAISVSTGNESDIKLGEAIATVSEQEGVLGILVVTETIRDGAEFIAAVRSARARGQWVTICPLGVGEHSTELVASHTGALAVPRVISEGVFRSLGVAVAATPAEAFDMASVLAKTPALDGPRVGIVTHSGGMAILLSDLAERQGVGLAPPSPELGNKVAGSLDHGSVTNPLDMGGIIGGPGRFADVVSSYADSGEYDVVLAVSTAHPPHHTEERVDSLLRRTGGVPVVHLWMAGDQGSHGLARLREAGLAVIEEPRAALLALAALARGPGGLATTDPLHGPPDEWGLPPLDGVAAQAASEIVAAADRIGYPVVLKLEVSALGHKTEVGGVRLGLRSADEVIEAHLGLTAIARDHGWDDASYRVQSHHTGLEMIVGAIRHEIFGPMISVGIGGVFTEIFGDVVFGLAPLDVSSAARLIGQLRGGHVLDGHRGMPPADRDELARIVSGLSRGFAGSDLAGFEINPLLWDGERWIVVDRLMGADA